MGEEGLATLGFLVRGRGRPFRIFAKPKFLLSDEAALKAGLDVKGASGLVCCITCLNICSDLELAKASEYVKHISCSDCRMFDLCAGRHYADRVRELQQMVDRRATKISVHNREVEFGINHNPHGLLADRELCDLMPPEEAVLYDGMHCQICSGALNLEFHLFMRDAKLQGVTWGHFKAAVDAQWSWPWHLRCVVTRTVKDCFNDLRKENFTQDRTFKGTAQEIVSVFSGRVYTFEFMFS